MMDTIVPFTLASLAVYRLSFLVTAETGPFEVFQRWREYWRNKEVRQGHPNWITDGMFCQLCTSFWFGIVAAVVWYFSPTLLFWGSLPFALSSITLLLKKRYG